MASPLFFLEVCICGHIGRGTVPISFEAANMRKGGPGFRSPYFYEIRQVIET